jgi:protein-disulfide isomerase
MRRKVDIIVTAVLVLCALLTTSVALRREFLGPRLASVEAQRKPILIKDWRAQLAKGIRVGPADAPVQLMEFADFECPYCATFHKDVKALQARYPSKVALVYVHFPLPMHRFAEPAARVAECASAQGRFEPMYDRLFDQQDSFGLKPWSEFGAEAGVLDRAAFEACISSKTLVPRIAEGKLLGKELDVQGTPTLVINGWKLGRPPNLEVLDRMVKAILSGKSPTSAD